MLSLLARQTAIGILTLVVLYAPFWRGPSTMKHLSAGPNFNKLLNSPAARAYRLLESRLCGHEAKAPVGTIDPVTGEQVTSPCRKKLAGHIRIATLGAFAIVFIGLTFYPIRTRESFFERGMWILAAYNLLGAYDFHPWYILWVTALIPLARRPLPILWVATCTVFFLYIPLRVPEIVALVFAPLAAAMVWELTSRWRGGSKGDAIPDDPRFFEFGLAGVGAGGAAGGRIAQGSGGPGDGRSQRAAGGSRDPS